MRGSGMKSMRAGVVLLFGTALLCPAARPQSEAQPRPQAAPAPIRALVLTLDAAQSSLHWTLDSSLHTVHGTFALKSGIVHLDPAGGKADGEVVVSTATGQSGNGSRDKRMHKEILETEKYPEIVFRPAQVEGRVQQNGASDVKIAGVLSIHGGEHDLTVPVHVEFSGGRWNASAIFDVPYVKWGIKDPSNFLLHVKPVVHVELEMSGEVRAAD